MAMRDGTPLPMRADRMGRRLLRMVLSSTSDLGTDTELSVDQAKRGMRDLIREELVAGAEIGCLLPGIKLHWFTEKGLVHFEASAEQASWHGPEGVGNLVIYDLTKVEAAYAIGREYATGGWVLSGIHWAERQPMTAMLEYSHPDEIRPAYLTLCCASMMDTQFELFARLQAVPAATQAQAIDPSTEFYPAGLAIVAATEWGAARALTMACAVLSAWVPPTHITAWFYSDDGWHVSNGVSVQTGTPPRDLPSLLPPTRLLRPSMSVRKLGKNRKLTRITDRCLWAGRAGHKLLELVTLVGICPVGAVTQYQDLVGEKPGRTETKTRLKRLLKLGLVEVVRENAPVEKPKRLPKGVPVTLSKRGQGGRRHALTKAGRAVFCYAHGGRPSDLKRRTKMGRLRTKLRDGSVVDRWPYRHEDILYEVLGMFAKEGCSVALGWQARTTLANGKRIDPDGMVLARTLWGRDWCCFEIELSDRSYSAAKPRCGKYASKDRRDNHPALVVCLDDLAEKNFHAAGAEFEPPAMMLTTTLRRLRDGGVLGAGVWSHYGVPVTLAAPGL